MNREKEEAKAEEKKNRKFVVSFGDKDKLKEVLVAKLGKNAGQKVFEKASLSYQINTSTQNVLGYKDLDEFNGLELNVADIIELSIKLFKINGIYSDIIDTWTGLVCSGIIVGSTGNQDYDNQYRLFIRDFNKNLKYTDTGFKSYVYNMVRECFLAGSTYYSTQNYTKYDSKIKEKSLEANAKEIKYADVSIQLPEVINYNPTEVEIEDEFITENSGKITYTDEERDDIYQMAFKKSMYNKYGTPLLSKIMNELYSYLLVKVMDNSQLDDLIQLFILIKVPDDLLDDADEIAEAIRTAKRSNMMAAINEGIKVETIGVRNQYNDLTKKIKEAKLDVINSSGLSESILYGQSKDANSDTISVHVTKIISQIEEMQTTVVSALKNIFESFAEKNGIDIVPEISLSKTILKLFLLDRHFLQLYDRGLISGIDLVEQAGFDHSEIIFSMQEEILNKYSEFGFGVMKDLPYYKAGNPSNTTNPDDDDKKGDRN